MAEKPQTQERTEKATPKRLRDARQRAQIPRSRELTTMLLMFAGASAMYLSSRHLLGGLTDVMRNGFVTPKQQIFDVLFVPSAFTHAVVQTLGALAPLLVSLALIGILAPLMIGGWVFDAGAVRLKWERLDPIKGLKRGFGPRGVLEMFKALAKFILILGFAVAVLYNRFDDVVALGLGGLERGVSDGSRIILQVFFVASAATIIIALADIPYQIWEHARALRMSRQELKDELKESEGSPELKGRIRGLQQELAARRMMEKVPEADVVITNPSHYAVALRFDPQTMGAPRVVAKGADHLALRIGEVARDTGVTVMSAPPLARAIYHSTRLDHEIPAGLHVAVAQVLAYVFHIKRSTAGAERPEPPRDYPIPEEFRR